MITDHTVRRVCTGLLHLQFTAAPDIIRQPIHVAEHTSSDFGCQFLCLELAWETAAFHFCTVTVAAFAKHAHIPAWVFFVSVGPGARLCGATRWQLYASWFCKKNVPIVTKWRGNVFFLLFSFSLCLYKRWGAKTIKDVATWQILQTNSKTTKCKFQWIQELTKIHHTALQTDPTWASSSKIKPWYTMMNNEIWIEQICAKCRPILRVGIHAFEMVRMKNSRARCCKDSTLLNEQAILLNSLPAATNTGTAVWTT